MSEFYWISLCSFFDLPKLFYLSQNPKNKKESWDLVQSVKRWNQETLECKQKEFSIESATLDWQYVLTWEDSSYPNQLRRLHHPPLMLTYKGSLEALSEKNIEVIGSRQPSPIFLHWMDHELSLFMSEFQGVVVSGGAIGVDQKASEIALRHQRKTIIVLPSGLESIYPANLRSWREDPGILFLSEYWPKQVMKKYHFLKRNRIIAGLSQHLLVVQCAQKSGTMMTVKYAIELGLDIATIPDFPGAYESSGNLNLLKDGAFFITSQEDLHSFVR
jgi:DNA processing protein